jgi:serine protease inhibitor
MNGKTFSATTFRPGLIAALLCLLCHESYAAPLPNPQALAFANDSFGINLLQQLVAEQPGSNIFISPYSASTALQMVCSGAVGITRTQIQQMLGTSELMPGALFEANRRIDDIINAKNTNYTLTAANAVWYLRGFPIELSFLEGNEKFFGAKVAGLDFALPSAVDTINAWASDATQGKIDQIVTSPMDPSLRVLLANAVYFHGNWEYKFDTNYTTDRTFYLPGGSQESIPMMEQTNEFNYFATNGYQALELPYQGTNLAMYILLPGPDSSVEELLGAMSGPWWQQLLNVDLTPQKGTLILPKFNLNYSVELNEPLQALGMTTAFTPDADFSKISQQPLCISKVQQQAIVEVNEEGTVAAAVTTIGVIATVEPVDPPPPFQMLVDRPFLFLIEDQQAQTILFMGAVFDP